MTNDVDTDSALQAVSFCCAISNFALQAPGSTGPCKFVVAFGCFCHSISSGGEMINMREKVDFDSPDRWPLPAVVASLSRR